MAIRPHLAVLERNMELQKHAGEFVSLARILMQSKGDFFEAREISNKRQVSPRVRDIFHSANARDIISKAATSPMSLSGNPQLADYQLVVSAFGNSLASVGAFDAILSSMKPAPLSSSIGSVATGVQGFTVSEQGAKPIGRLTVNPAGPLDALKSHSIVTATQELLKMGGPSVQSLLAKELVLATTLAVDSAFIGILLANISVGTSVGQTAVSVRQDLASLLAAIPSDQSSRFFIITTPQVCKSWCAMGSTFTSGQGAFPDMGPQGGTILNIPVIASDAATTGLVILVDASGLAGASDQIILSVMDQGSLQLDSSPDSPPIASSVMVSLWQMNMTALRAERWWGCRKLRAASVAAVSNSSSYAQGMSPP